LHAGAHPSLVAHLEHRKHNIIKEAAWTVSNIKVTLPIIKVVETGDFEAQRKAVWAVTNITTGGTTNILSHPEQKVRANEIH
jgi:importin subunit alpha-2